MAGFFAGHFNQTQFGKAKHVGFGIIGFQPGFQLKQDRFFVGLFLHVDKIGDNNSADIAKPQLTGNFRHRFHVCAKNRVSQVGMTGKTTGVYINYRQGFGFVNDQIPAAFEVDAAISQAVPFVLNPVVSKDFCFSFIQMNLFHQIRRQKFGQFDHTCVSFSIIDHNFFDVIFDMVADNPNHQIGVTIEQQRSFRFLGFGGQRLP